MEKTNAVKRFVVQKKNSLTDVNYAHTFASFFILIVIL